MSEDMDDLTIDECIEALSGQKSEIMWLKSAIVSILSLAKSENPPSHEKIAELCQYTLDKSAKR